MEGADILMDKDQVIEAHGDMLNWATELIKASLPALRAADKNNFNARWAPTYLPERLKQDGRVVNHQVFKEAQDFLEMMNCD